VELEFPLEFIVYGVAISLQNSTPATRRRWKETVKQASLPHLPEGHFATSRAFAVTLYYMPPGLMQGDVDNIVKLVIDALERHIYINDRQIQRVVVQKFEPGILMNFSNPSATLTSFALGDRPALYIRISDDPSEDL
jgi:hypothetical protein